MGPVSWHLRGVDTKANERRSKVVSAAAALLDRLGRPGDVRLGTAQTETIPRLSTGLAALDRALGGGLPRGRVIELAGRRSTGRTGLPGGHAAHAPQGGGTNAPVHG